MPGKPRNRNLESSGFTNFSKSGFATIVCHEHSNGRKAEEVRNCSTDEGRPLGTSLKEQVPNHLRRLWAKAMVVNAEGKGLE